ncbi:YafY family protein [Priestia megaterium]|uniref:helix-turn-helix transcriptional regulator n=1 Tax=Priestia megaterium TaxID=1404 RepID=UPI003391900E
MAKSRRLVDMLMFINTKRTFTAKELAEEFGLSVRTVQRYLLDLSELGLPLYSEKGRSGGYRVLKNRILPPILFTEEEAISIFFAYQALQYYHDLPFDAEIHAALQKFYVYLSEETKKKVDKMSAHIAFWNPKRNLDTPYLKELLEASLAGKYVEFLYDSQTGQTRKQVKPLGIYAHNGLWYCPAYSCDKQKVLLFRADRIHSLKVLEKDENMSLTLKEWLETEPVNSQPISLKVTLTHEGVRQCKGVPWLENHVKMARDGNGYIDTITDGNELNYMASFFYTLGAHAFIEEPQELIEKICYHAEETLRHYKNEAGTKDE